MQLGRKTLYFLVIPALLGAWTPSVAAPAAGQVTGEVVPTRGESRPPRIVLTLRSSVGAVVEMTTASSDGRFAFFGVDPGDYVLSAHADGHRSSQVEIRARAFRGGSADVTIELGAATGP